MDAEDEPDPGPGIEGLEDIVKREKLQRLIVVTPAKEGQRSYLDAISSEVGRTRRNSMTVVPTAQALAADWLA